MPKVWCDPDGSSPYPNAVCKQNDVHGPHDWYPDYAGAIIIPADAQPRWRHCPGMVDIEFKRLYLNERITAVDTSDAEYQYGWEAIRSPCPDGTAECERTSRMCQKFLMLEAHVCHDWMTGTKSVHCPGYAHMPSDEVNHPTYYGGDTPYEVLKVAIAWEKMFGLSFLSLQSLKYIARNGRKPGQDGRKDLREAVFYLKQEFARRYPGETL